jgi:protein O-GlcNAc transferase
VIPKVLLGKSRHDFGLRDDACVYLACQSTFKYLPQDDAVLPAIAQRVPHAQFVFLTPHELVAGDYQARIHRAFAEHGLDAAEWCVFLRGQCTFDYWNLNLVADVFLDSFEWSGCNTTMEAIACGLPVVTTPGKLMRGRHSFAILTQLGVVDTIARDRSDYVAIAARLALDPAWRTGIVEEMERRWGQLYSDVSSVRALEAFYRRVVQQALPEDRPVAARSLQEARLHHGSR